MKVKKLLKTACVSLAISSILLGCGHKQGPSGGAIDKTPPEIISVTPDEYTDISKMDVSIVFSKPIKRANFLSNISIYPPVAKLDLNWNNETLTIEFEEDLLANENYYIQLSPKITDIYGNKIKQEYSFIFNTGKIFNETARGEFKFEKTEDKALPVTISLLSADSVKIYTKVYETNSFELASLKKQQYILKAYADKNKNNKYDVGIDPYSETKFNPEVNKIINPILEYIDTKKPEIKKITSEANNKLKIEFSEELKNYKGIKVYSKQKELALIGASLEKDKLFLLTEKADSLSYLVEFNTLIDLKGNETLNDTMSVKYASINDTIPPSIINFKPANGEVVNTTMPAVEIEFSEIILDNHIFLNLYSVESNKKVGLHTPQKSGRFFTFIPDDVLYNYETYILEISKKCRDWNGNALADSVASKFIVIKK